MQLKRSRLAKIKHVLWCSDLDWLGLFTYACTEFGKLWQVSQLMQDRFIHLETTSILIYINENALTVNSSLSYWLHQLLKSFIRLNLIMQLLLITYYSAYTWKINIIALYFLYYSLQFGVTCLFNFINNPSTVYT